MGQGVGLGNRLFRALAIAFLGLAVSTAFVGPATGHEDDEDVPQTPDAELSSSDDPDLPLPIQSAEEAAAMDAALVEAHTKVPPVHIDEGELSDRAERKEAFSEVRVDVIRNRPELFAGGSVWGAPTLYIKGQADEWVRSRVEAAPITIKIVEGMQYTWHELEQRSWQLHAALKGLGFTGVGASFDETTGQLDGTVEVTPGLPSTPAALAALLPPSLARGTDFEVVTGPTSEDFHAIGGSAMYHLDDHNGAPHFRCQAGFTVQNLTSGDNGITSAGHCRSLTHIEDLHNNGQLIPLKHRNQHIGQYGDVEWKTTAHIEPPIFYAAAGVPRFVTSRKAVSGMSPGDDVCSFSRQTVQRLCDIVYKVSVSKEDDEGRMLGRLVMMRNNWLQPGDSGGTWSYENKAWGIIQGRKQEDGFWRDVFTPVDNLPEALNVEVKKQE